MKTCPLHRSQDTWRTPGAERRTTRPAGGTEREVGLGLRLVRVDDRLIHGQVVAIGLKALGAKRIVIVDDVTARDDFLREVIELTAPSGVPVEIHDLASGTDRGRQGAAPRSGEPTAAPH